MDWINFFRILGYVALIFGAVCTVGVDYLKNKEDDQRELRQQTQMTDLSNNVKNSNKLLEPFSDLATKLYPNLEQKEALEKLRTRMDSADREIKTGSEKVSSLNTELNLEKNTIKTFDVTVSIEFSGNWKEQPYPLWLQPAKPTPYMRWRDSSKKYPDLEFCTSRINYETINANTGLFRNTLSILPGQFPLGELKEILKTYDKMEFWILFTTPEKLLGPKIVFNKIDLVFSINGKKIGELHDSSHMSQDYTTSLQALIPGKNLQLTPTIELTGKPVDILKFSF